jgi:hypothetical protein
MDEPSVASRFMSRSQLAASRYAQEWGKPQSLIDYMDFFLIHSPTRLASLGFSRHERDGDFTEREIEIGRLLIPHLRRAVTISNVLDTQAIEKARMAEALDALKLGVVPCQWGQPHPACQPCGGADECARAVRCATVTEFCGRRARRPPPKSMPPSVMPHATRAALATPASPCA